MRISDWSSDVYSSDPATMKAHAAFPDPHDHQRILEQIGKCIEQHIADTPAEHHPKHAVEQQVTKGVGVDPGKAAGIDAPGTQPRGHHEGERSEEHTSELQSLMRISYAVFCLKKKTYTIAHSTNNQIELRNQCLKQQSTT